MNIAICCNLQVAQSRQQQQGIQDWSHGAGAYNLGLVMGQHVDIIAIYWRHRVQQLSVAVLVNHANYTNNYFNLIVY